MEALAQAFHDLSIVIASDWSSPATQNGCRFTTQRVTTPEEVRDSFVRLAAGMPNFGISGSIHPQWDEGGFMFGHWGF